MKDIGYCMNVHPANDLQELYENFNHYAIPIYNNVKSKTNKNIGVELHLNHVVSRELASQIDAFNQFIDKNNIDIFSINNFPLIDFHQPVVKDKVYLPSWAETKRLEQTKLCADILSQLNTKSDELTISTLAGCWKYHKHDEDLIYLNYIQMVKHLIEIFEQTGKKIRIALEPEPDTSLDSLNSILYFFKKLTETASENHLDDSLLLNYIGLNFDTCHSSVLFEKPLHVVSELIKNKIPIYKFHITNAPKLESPFTNENKKAFKSLNEPKYLHQTKCMMENDKIIHFKDLDELDFDQVKETKEIRTHFHVPLNLTEIGFLKTTQSEVKELIEFLPNELFNTPMVVETYTWPQHLNATGGKKIEIAEGISQELVWLIENL